MAVILYTEKGPVELSDDTLIVWVDDTGTESMRDKNYPAFGFGATVILAKDIEANVLKPWRKLKEDIFGDSEYPLHITDEISSGIKQEKIDKISDFFIENNFGRLGAVTTNKSDIAIGNFELLELMLKVLILMLKDYITKSKVDFNSLVFIFEESPEIKRVSGYMRDDFLDKLKSEGKHVDYFYESKKAREPALEIADIIAHTAGSQARTFIKEGKKFNKDFEVIFKRNDNRQSYMLVTKSFIK